MAATLTSISSSKPFKISIIGGGITGVTLAIGLLEQNIPVTIFEAAPTFHESGLGMFISPNGVQALNLLSHHALEAFKKCVRRYDSLEQASNIWSSFRYGMDSRSEGKKAGDLIYQLDHDEPITRTTGRVHRARFLEELVKLIPDSTIKFGKTLVSLKQVGEEEGNGVHLRFADKTEEIFDAVIACDGIKSRTRAVIFQREIKPQFAGEWGYRALFSSNVVREILGDELASTGQLYCGYGSWIIHYPVGQGEFVNVVAVTRAESWDSKDWIVQTSKQDMMAEFEGWWPPLLDLLSKFPSSEKWGFFDVSHNFPYFKGRACLAGDAAHATTANLGAGAGMAIEDALILSNALGLMAKEHGGVERIQRAFQAYDIIRRERTQLLVSCSRLAGLANEFGAEGIGDDFGKLQADISRRYCRVWNVNLTEELEKLQGTVRRTKQQSLG